MSPADSADARINLGVLLLIPYRHMEERVFNTIQEAGFNDWTLAQAKVFQRIAPEGSRLTTLAAQSQMTKQSAGVLVDELERLGYVRRVPDPTDKRARLIQIQDRGWRAIEVGQVAHDSIVAEWQQYLGTRNFTVLRELLEQLREITDPFAGIRDRGELFADAQREPSAAPDTRLIPKVTPLT
jgi:DNA-binding MarR family transcriptional regulator